MFPSILSYFSRNKKEDNYVSCFSSLSPNIKRKIMKYYILQLGEDDIPILNDEDWEYLKRNIYSIRIYPPLEVGTYLNALDFGKGRKKLKYLNIEGNYLVCEADIKYLDVGTKVDMTPTSEMITWNEYRDNRNDFRSDSRRRSTNFRLYSTEERNKFEMDQISTTQLLDSPITTFNSIERIGGRLDSASKSESINQIDIRSKCMNAISSGVEKSGALLRSASSIITVTPPILGEVHASPASPLVFKLPELPISSFRRKMIGCKKFLGNILSILICGYNIPFMDTKHQIQIKNNKISSDPNNGHCTNSDDQVNVYVSEDNSGFDPGFNPQSCINRVALHDMNEVNHYFSNDSPYRATIPRTESGTNLSSISTISTISFLDAYDSVSQRESNRNSRQFSRHSRNCSIETFASMNNNDFLHSDLYGIHEYNKFEDECRGRGLLKEKKSHYLNVCIEKVNDNQNSKERMCFKVVVDK